MLLFELMSLIVEEFVYRVQLPVIDHWEIIAWVICFRFLLKFTVEYATVALSRLLDSMLIVNFDALGDC